MVKKVLFILLLVSLFLIPTIFASTFDINVKTKSDHKLLITALKSGDTYTVIKSFAPYKNTGTLGQVKVSLTTSDPTVSLKLSLITSEGANVLNEKFDDVPTGEPAFITLFPGNVSLTSGNPVVNTTADNLSATNISVENLSIVIAPNITAVENETKSNFSITGYASQLYEKNSKSLFYVLIVIGLIVGILIIVFIIRRIPKRSFDYPVKFRHKPLESASFHSNPALTEAEKKLKEAQQQIDSIKKRNEEIREAEIKLQEDRIRLDKLRKGY